VRALARSRARTRVPSPQQERRDVTAQGADVDHIAFVLPEDAKEVRWRADWAGESAPAGSITVDGETVKGGEPVLFFPGKRYVIKVENAADNASDDVIAVGFNFDFAPPRGVEAIGAAGGRNREI
jgi:hypothetical protein